MPKWAARIWLRVEDVRAEQLHEIDDAGARAEGVRSPLRVVGAQRRAFAGVWDSINADRGFPWANNDLVRVVRLQRREQDGEARVSVDSLVEWCHDTVSAWWGCSKVSAACKFCYAEAIDARFKRGGETHWGDKAPRFLQVESALAELDRIAPQVGPRRPP